jgi:hypothetical protein
VSPNPPNFDELAGPDVSGAERDRLRRTHDLLVQAGPPPELSPELEQVPWPEEALQPLGLFGAQRRRGRPRLQLALVAAALLVTGFLIGQAFTARSNGFPTAVQIVQMKGTAAAPQAIASVAVARRGNDGNWPMLLSVSNLPPARDGYYDLWLSKNGKPRALCGSFNTHLNGDTTVRMSAAYEFRHGDFDGWIIVRHLAGVPESQAPTVLSTDA